MGLTLDFTKKDFKEALKGFSPLPKGAYPVILQAFEEGMAESSGQPKVKVTYVIEAGAPTGAGRQVIKDYSLQPKAVWRWTNDMTALGGIPSDYFDDNTKVDVAAVCEANVGRKATAVLDDPDEGYTNNKLSKLRPRTA